ncbi:MAG: sigma-70 family RNA polymerase sigma factor [Phycisphaerae bacterium]|nr:sigma-70 family RNA polymerase sigma factor [Gemmatimonadaceae bacterium]
MNSVPPTPDAFSLQIEAVLARLGRLVRATGLRHGVGDEEAGALIQEVRIRLWRAHASSEEIGRLPTSYVYRTAITAALDLVRKRRRNEDREPSLDTAPMAALVSRNAADSDALASDLGAAIMRELNTMVEARRVVVRMHLAGYERDEMTSLLGWSDAKVRNLLYRGLQDLRARLTTAGYRWPDDS